MKLQQASKTRVSLRSSILTNMIFNSKTISQGVKSPEVSAKKSINP